MDTKEHDACIKAVATFLASLHKGVIGPDRRGRLIAANLKALGYPADRPLLQAKVEQAVDGSRPAIVIEAIIRQAFGEIEAEPLTAFGQDFNRIFARA